MRIVRRAVELPPATETLRRELVERELEEAPSAADLQELRRVFEGMALPHVVPAYDRVVVDRTGALWVEEYDPRRPPASEWIVFGEAGEFLGRVRMPRRLRPMEIGAGYVLGVFTDELDVEHVLVVELLRGEG